MLRCPSFIQIINDHANVSTPYLEIQRSKLQETIVVDSKFGNTCKFMVFVIVVRRNCSTKDG
jgi:hypothetical protein